ncbi:MAG: dTMP kinase [Candidatus Brocadiia bacterium]
MKKGLLLVICGIDGSGKTVQSRHLCENIRSVGHTARYVEFPHYEEGFFGNLCARYLRGDFASDAGSVNPYLASLPFACDRWESRDQLTEWLQRGDAVVCNRYVSANLAHQGSKIEDETERNAFCQWDQKLEYNIFGLPRPDLHFWLDMPVNIAAKLIGTKGKREYLKDSQDIHESDTKHLESTREVYQSLARQESNWITIAGAAGEMPRSKEEIANEIWETVRPLCRNN